QELEGSNLAVDGPVTFAFTQAEDQGWLSVSGGCNTMQGSFELDGDTLRWADEVIATLEACGAPLDDLDQLMRLALSAGVEVTLAEDALTLATDSLTVHLLDEASVEPEAELIGTQWVLAEVHGDAGTITVSDEIGPPTVQLADDGILHWV